MQERGLDESLSDKDCRALGTAIHCWAALEVGTESLAVAPLLHTSASGQNGLQSVVPTGGRD